MASGSSLDSDGGFIELKVILTEVVAYRKVFENISFHIFCGYTDETQIQRIEGYKNAFLYKGRFIPNLNFNENLCLFSINVTEKTKNELGQDCSRNIGDVSFEILKEYKNHGKKAFSFTNKPISNHCLDDEIHEVPQLKNVNNRVMGHVSGTIQIIELNAKKIVSTSVGHVNDIIYHHFIEPWYNNLDVLAPSGPITEEIHKYHVPVFRVLSGSMLPFSFSLLWKNRYFDQFEYNFEKCSLFVRIIYDLLESSVFFHPEFINVSDFYKKCTDFIKKNRFGEHDISCVDVIVNMLNLKTSSEPYVSDQVDVPKLAKKISVDQMSNVHNIYGCDCEDGGKCAYELKRIICNSDWERIIQTLNRDGKAVILKDTVVKILRMYCAFMTVMYCARGICHVVTVLFNWNASKSLLGVDQSQKVGRYEEKPLDRITSSGMLFVETTSYSSPFQFPMPTDEEEESRKIAYFSSVGIKNIMREEKSAEVMDLNPIFSKRGQISAFYRYFTNFMTTEFLSVIPNVLDFLPVKGSNYGFAPEDVCYNIDSIKLVPRLKITQEIYSLMNNVILSQLPSYDIVPDNIPYMEKYFNDKSVGFLKDEINSQISEKGSPKLKRIMKKKKTNDYVRVNYYVGDLLMRHNSDVIRSYIVFHINDILDTSFHIKAFDFRIKKVYSDSTQTIVLNLFFYYDKDSSETQAFVRKYMKESTPTKIPTQYGRK